MRSSVACINSINNQFIIQDRVIIILAVDPNGLQPYQNYSHSEQQWFTWSLKIWGIQKKIISSVDKFENIVTCGPIKWIDKLFGNEFLACDEFLNSLCFKRYAEDKNGKRRADKTGIWIYFTQKLFRDIILKCKNM